LADIKVLWSLSCSF